MLYWLLPLCAAVALLIILFLRSEKKRGAAVFREALELEQSGSYSTACYAYAIAASAGHRRHLCDQRIQELWRRHGPFDFPEQHRAAVTEYCRYASCGEGIHELTLGYIRKLVAD